MAKILLVDDSQTIVAVVQSWLTSMGHETVVVSDGYGALPAFTKHNPDLVILDYQMPAASGTEVLQRMRNLTGGAAVPVVFLSAESPYQLENMVADRSRVRFLQKPVDEKAFRQTLGELLAANPKT